jgi:large subunit ribosomal protein L6
MGEMLTRLERKELVTKGINVTVDSQLGKVRFEKDNKVLSVDFDPVLMTPVVEGDRLLGNALGQTRQHAQRLGTFLSQAGSAIAGITTGFKVDLEIKGTGFKVASKTVDGKVVLVFQLGYSNESASTYVMPDNVIAKIGTPTQLSLESIDKQALGQVAANIRSLRKVNPYKGKGILVKGQVLILKETKKKK